MRLAIGLALAIVTGIVMYFMTSGQFVLSLMTGVAAGLAVLLAFKSFETSVQPVGQPPIAVSSSPISTTQGDPEAHVPEPEPEPAPKPAPVPVPEVSLPETFEPREVVRALRTSTRAATAHLWLADPNSDTLRLVVCDGPIPVSDTPVPLGEGVLGRAGAGDTPATGKVSRLTTPQETTVVYRYAVRVGVSDMRGVAAVDFRDAEPDFAFIAERFAPLLTVLGGSLTLHASRLETHATRELLDAARELTRLLEPQSVLEAALSRAIDIAAGKTASILLMGDDGYLNIAASRGLEDSIVEATSLAVGEGIAGWVFASGTPLVIEDLDGKNQGRRHGVRSAISVPIADEDGVLGVLNVGSSRFIARASDSHLRALESLGRLTALALRNARAVQTSGELYLDTLKALVRALETKDPYAQGGTERVFELARMLGREVHMSDEEYDALSLASLLHDIGMIAAGETAMVGGRPLSVAERGLLKMHPVIAAEILESAPALANVVPIVYHHHERFDGTGYVAGYSGEQIPLGARVLAVADAYVAMTSDRPYRAALTHEQAIAELRTMSGTQFDPLVVDAFTRLMKNDSNRVPDGAESLRC